MKIMKRNCKFSY